MRQRQHIIECATSSDAQALAEYLAEYRLRHGVLADQLIPCNIADDTTSVAAPCIRTSPWKRGLGSALTFFMLPLDQMLPNLSLQTIAHWSGRIDEGILRPQDMFCQPFETSRFLCHFVASDGDTGVSLIQKGTFGRYEKLDVNVSLLDVVKELTKTGPPMKWPVSDFLHLMTNADATTAKGSLAFDANSPAVTAKQLTNEVDCMNI
jgi:hypothetical protein